MAAGHWRVEAGHVRLAFAAFLVLGVLLSGWPMLAHLQRQLALNTRAAALLSRPLEAEIAEVLGRAARLSAHVRAYHDALEAAEAYLWEFKNNRESSLILKDVGNADGELGLSALRAAYPEMKGGLARLGLALSRAEQDWNALRDQTSLARIEALEGDLREVARRAGAQGELLKRYQIIAENTGKTIAAFSRLAPLVVGRVPKVVSRLPGQLQRLGREMRGLEEALKRIAGEVPTADPRP